MIITSEEHGELIKVLCKVRKIQELVIEKQSLDNILELASECEFRLVELIKPEQNIEENEVI